MRALWSDRPNCSHNVSQKVKRIWRLSEFYVVLKGILAGLFRTTSRHKDYVFKEINWSRP